MKNQRMFPQDILIVALLFNVLCMILVHSQSPSTFKAILTSPQPSSFLPSTTTNSMGTATISTKTTARPMSGLPVATTTSTSLTSTSILPSSRIFSSSTSTTTRPASISPSSVSSSPTASSTRSGLTILPSPTTTTTTTMATTSTTTFSTGITIPTTSKTTTISFSQVNSVAPSTTTNTAVVTAIATSTKAITSKATSQNNTSASMTTANSRNVTTAASKVTNATTVSVSTAASTAKQPTTATSKLTNVTTVSFLTTALTAKQSITAITKSVNVSSTTKVETSSDIWTTSSTKTTKVPPNSAAQHVLIISSDSFDLVYGQRPMTTIITKTNLLESSQFPTTTWYKTSVAAPATVATTAKSVLTSAATTTGRVAITTGRTATGNAATTTGRAGITMSGAATTVNRTATTIVATTNSQLIILNNTASGFSTGTASNLTVAYASFLAHGIATAAKLSNVSRITELGVVSGDRNNLVIRCTILDGETPTAAEAVANLRRPERRRKRAVPAQNLFMLTDLYNQTVAVQMVINWTDFGPCPNQTCLNGGKCRSQPTGSLYCDCPSLYSQSPICDVTATAVTNQDSCASRVSCIVPAIVVPIVGFLLILIIVIVIVVVCVRRRRTSSGQMNDNQGKQFSKRAKNGKGAEKKERRTITTVNSAFENAMFEGDSSGRQTETLTMQQVENNSSSDDKDNSAKRAENRSRFKKAKRESAKNGGAQGSKKKSDDPKNSQNPDNIDSVYIVDEGVENSHSLRKADGESELGTSTLTSQMSASNLIPSDMAASGEIMSY